MIYLDHNATAPLHPEVAELLRRGFEAAVSNPGNASSVHRAGRSARARADDARATIAKLLEADPREICFTSSGTEANVLALRGSFLARKETARKRIVASGLEHPSIRLTLRQLADEGAEVITVNPDPTGRINEADVLAQLDDRTALCTLMMANNETGVLQPVDAVAKACRARGILFHTDAVQAVGKVPVSVRALEVDLLSLAAHKLGGPIGIGALVVRRSAALRPVHPGHQEAGRRGGTLPVVLVEAFALALELSCQKIAENALKVSALRDRLESGARSAIPDVHVNGGSVARLPNTSNLRFEGIDGETLLIALDLAGVCASSGAACASGTLSPSHVLLAMGLRATQAQASVRFSLGAGTSDADIERVLELLVEHVPKARAAALHG